MKTITKILSLILAVSSLSLSGCAITSAPDTALSTPAISEPVGSSHRLSEAVQTGKLEGFKGTSSFVFSGKNSPNLSEDQARQILTQALSDAGMLAPKNAQYDLNAFVKDTDECSMFCSKSQFSMHKNIIIEYILESVATGDKLFDSIIKSHGHASCADGDPCIGFHRSEGVASARSYKDNFEKMISELKKVK